VDSLPGALGALRHTRKLAALALAATAVAATGCGREDPVDLANGKELFIGEGTCGSCHKLARAGTKGTQGPDLDVAFGPSRAAGMNAETVEGVVFRQIAHPIRKSIMPADLVTGDDARDVAAYVAKVAGIPGEDTGELASIGASAEAKPVEATGPSLTLPADPSGALAFVAPDPDANPGTVTQIVASPGRLEIVMPNESPIQHNVAVEELNAIGEVVGTGGTSQVEVDLEPGTYRFLCTVPGHAEGGMAGELTVE